jgi:hypothetical protein
MWDRLLFAIDQFESGQVALKFTTGLANSTGAEVRVLHIRKISRWARVPPLETLAEAELLVQQAVFSLRIAGVGRRDSPAPPSKTRSPRGSWTNHGVGRAMPSSWERGGCRESTDSPDADGVSRSSASQRFRSLPRPRLRPMPSTVRPVCGRLRWSARNIGFRPLSSTFEQKDRMCTGRVNRCT